MAAFRVPEDAIPMFPMAILADPRSGASSDGLSADPPQESFAELERAEGFEGAGASAASDVASGVSRVPWNAAPFASRVVPREPTMEEVGAGREAGVTKGASINSRARGMKPLIMMGPRAETPLQTWMHTPPVSVSQSL